MPWIWQLPGWPNFTWDSGTLLPSCAQIAYDCGVLRGKLDGIQVEDTSTAEIEVLVAEAMATSAIEGEMLERESVRSSIARKLGVEKHGLKPGNRHTDGLIEMLQDAVQNFDQDLTLKRLCGWQAALFPTGYSGIHEINVGTLRGNEPMRVISGKMMESSTIHFEAPPRACLEQELGHFLDWFNNKDKNVETNGFIRAGIAHLWFVTLHPFDDGNGRLTRAITDMALSKAEDSSRRMIAISSSILEDRSSYYDILEKTQRGSLDITEWLIWFLAHLSKAIHQAENDMTMVLNKAKFWRNHQDANITDRQKKAINKMLDVGSDGFEGGITTRKYASINGVSKPTATRELADLLHKKILVTGPEKGRSTHYIIAPESLV